jgi:hypothetical protein
MPNNYSTANGGIQEHFLHNKPNDPASPDDENPVWAKTFGANGGHIWYSQTISGKRNDCGAKQNL